MYRDEVTPMLEWPIASEIIRSGIPAALAYEANECRRSWKLTIGSFNRRIVRPNARARYSVD
jgi:hypothetical protein